MNAPSTRLGLLAAAILLVVTTQASASTNAYNFFDLGTHGETNPNSSARAINNAGQVAGFSYGSDEPASNLALLWNGTTATQLGMLPGGFQSTALGINDAGQVVGYSRTLTEPRTTTLWNGTTATDLGVGPNDSTAYGINNAGLVVGNTSSGATVWNDTIPSNLPRGGIAYAITNAGLIAGTTDDKEGNIQAAVWNDITKPGIPLNDPPDAIQVTDTVAVALNDHGQTVGYANDNGFNWRALSWNGTTVTILDKLPGGGASSAYGINDAGQIVGYSTVGVPSIPMLGGAHATLWDDNKTIDLNNLLDPGVLDAGWVLRNAYDINDKGWIVGDAYNVKLGITHAFLLSPVPEPEIYAMFLAGLGLLGFMARRRKIA